MADRVLFRSSELVRDRLCLPKGMLESHDEEKPMIRTVIVEDELLAREALRRRLISVPDVEIVDEAARGDAAVEQILRLRPDLLLLDVQIPGISGFEVLEAVSSTHLPLVIFVTAHEEHAVRAFEINAVDYLLKPFTEERLHQALERVRTAIGNPDEASDEVVRLGRLLDTSSNQKPDANPSGYLQRIPVRKRDRFILIRVQEIDFIEAAGNYVRIRTESSSSLFRSTLSDLERKLDPSMFARIHRSTIVNLDRVAEIRAEHHGDFEVFLTNGQGLRMSRNYRDRLLR
jgi:two-component system, LytTR family, response regulator